MGFSSSVENKSAGAAAAGGRPPGPARSQIELMPKIVRVLTLLLASLAACDVDLVARQSFDVQRPTHRPWLEAAQLRRLALFVLIDGLGLTRGELAEALGVSRQSVHQALHACALLFEKEPGWQVLARRAEALMKGDA